MLNDVLENFKNKREEMNIFIGFLFKTEEDMVYSQLLLFPILKASGFVMLYNAIESTVYLLFESLFDLINESQVPFSRLTVFLQNQYKKYGGKCSNVSDDDLTRLDFRNYSRRIHVFSGNLDARSIRLLLESWGILMDFHVDGEEELLIIKNHRNILAHGEKSFREIGRNYTVLEIEKFSECVFRYLSELMKCFSEFIENEQYIN